MAYAALWDHGINLDTARELVAQHHVDPERRARGGRRVADSAQAPDYAEDREALKAIGIDLDQVREAVRANLGADLADGWAARSERGRSRGDRRRGRRRHHHDHHDHHEGHDGTTRDAVAAVPAAAGTTARVSRAGCAPCCATYAASALHDRLEAESRDEARRVPGMTGARLLVALTRSDDPAVQAVLATATGLDGLRMQAEAGTKPGASA